jgi:hypothetical protein
MTSVHLEESETDYQPVDTRLIDDAEALQQQLEETTLWDLETFMLRARVYEAIVADADHMIDTADTYCEELDPELLDRLYTAIERCADNLYHAEHDSTLVAETFAAARDEFPSEPGDDELVTVGVAMNPLSFRRPQAHIVVLLLRQLVGHRFAGGYRLLTMPLWLKRRIEQHSPHTSIRIVAEATGVPSNDVLDVANGLWEPQPWRESAYMSVDAAIEAARLLDNCKNPH